VVPRDRPFMLLLYPWNPETWCDMAGEGTNWVCAALGCLRYNEAVYGQCLGRLGLDFSTAALADGRRDVG
jgi:hypothetical protein